MPRNAGNCDYTHFIFYILKPQGISLREQSPISSMAAEQIENSTSAEQGWGFAWRETNRDLTDVSRLCGPSWHLGKTLASFSRCFLLCYFLTFWITHPDSYGKKKKLMPHIQVSHKETRWLPLTGLNLCLHRQENKTSVFSGQNWIPPLFEE